MSGSPTPDEDELEVALREARERFVAGFAARCDEIERGVAALTGGAPPPAALKSIAHRIAGLAGTVGFPAVSREASELETLLAGVSTETPLLFERIAAMRAAFAGETAGSIAVDARPAAASTGQTILMVDDDPDQRRLTSLVLERAGYRVVALPHAGTILERAREIAPVLVLLDVEMPNIDGHLACRLLKTDPVVGDVPVIFVSSRAALHERMAGLALGAADYVGKPVDASELLFRVRRVIENRPQPAPVAVTSADLLEYADFAPRAQALFAAGAGTLALLRVDPKGQETLAATLIAESRRRDLIARFDRLHLIMACPDVTAPVVEGQLGKLLEAAALRGVEARAGVAMSASGSGGALDALIAEADEALAEARVHGRLVSRKGERADVTAPAAGPSTLVLVADDDPDVMRIVDAEIRTLRFATTLAFDGQMVLAALAAKKVDLIVLDLMLPKVTGFEVLHHLRTLDARPRVIVLSARGREQDITRAFDLGADDYITKPFRPHELGARVVRLLR